MTKYIKYKEEWSEFFDDNNVEEILDNALKDNVYPKKKNIFKIFKYLVPSEIKMVLLQLLKNRNYPLQHTNPRQLKNQTEVNL